MNLAALNLNLSEFPEPAEKSPPASPADLGIFISVQDLRARVASLLDEKWVTSQKPSSAKDFLASIESFSDFGQPEMVEKAEVENHILALTESKSQESQRFYQQLVDELIFEFSLEDKISSIFQDLHFDKDKFLNLLCVEFRKLVLKKKRITGGTSQIHQVGWENINHSFDSFIKENPDILNQKSNLGSAWLKFLASFGADDSAKTPNIKFVVKSIFQNIVDSDQLIIQSEIKHLKKLQVQCVLFLAAFLTQNQYDTFNQSDVFASPLKQYTGKKLQNYLAREKISLKDFVALYMPVRYQKIFNGNFVSGRPRMALRVVAQK